MENAIGASHLWDMRCFILDETGRLVESDPTFVITNGSGATLSDGGSCDVAVVFAPVKAANSAPHVEAQTVVLPCATCGK